MLTMNKPLSVAEADERLRYWFDACPAAAVALSGGVDSSLVAWYARQCLGKELCTAYIADSPSLKRADYHEAIAFCQRYDIAYKTLATQEMQNDNYTSNPNNRCYFCKTTLYDELVRQVEQNVHGAWICSGANFDDTGDYRPGLQAASEHQVYHPLLLCGLGKQSIRELAQHHGLPCWDKAASPCLSSRIPYGQDVTYEKLTRIEAAEAYLQELGFNIVRVRHFEKDARIEVPSDKLKLLQEQLSTITPIFEQLGFQKTEIDQEGFVSGKLNRGIAL